METETTNDVTCASIQKNSEPQLIWEGGIDPTSICSLFALPKDNSITACQRKSLYEHDFKVIELPIK